MKRVPSSEDAAAGEPSSAGLLLPMPICRWTGVRGMDADVLFDAASVAAPKLPLKKVHFQLTLDDGKLALAPLAFTLPQGQFSGTVSHPMRAAPRRAPI